MKALNKQIEEEALELAQQKDTEARSEKQKRLAEKRLKKRDLIGELAQIMITENESIIGQDIAQDAIEKLKEENLEIILASANLPKKI